LNIPTPPPSSEHTAAVRRAASPTETTFARRAADFLRSRRAAVLAGMILGAVFVAAAVPKIVDPPGFAHEVANYQLLPRSAVNAAALVLPWIEVFAGLALLLGFARIPDSLRRGGAALTLAFLAVFLVALSINLARNHPVDCGCFSTKETPKSPEQRIASMKLAILRDVGLAVLAIWSLRGEKEESP